ncbi:hypothetical protein ACF1BN_21605 [Streptomyces sp. NPDC014861]|uniref:hypothetical protein n=1 Tax=Streptomyces sp. NPDC014861 TaxID=3364923 RepID=UPI0036F594F3
MNQDRDDSGRVRKHVGWWIAALAGLAGIGGLVFAIVSQEHFTIKEWSKAANAACDSLHGEIVQGNEAANDAVDALADGGYQASGYQVAADAFDALSSSERKLTGEMGRIETPDSREGDVERLLEGLNDVSDLDRSLAGELREGVITDDSPFVADYYERRDSLVADVNEDFDSLDVRHCLAGE